MARNTTILRDIQSVVRRLLSRYHSYEKLIKYPGDWGERAFRFWLIKELFMDILGWHAEYIVFGERYDVLLLDEYIRPRIYVETKKPDIQITNRHIKEAIDRSKDFLSIDYVIITNGITWVLYDCVKNMEYDKIEDIGRINDEKVKRFFNKIHAKNYVGLG